MATSKNLISGLLYNRKSRGENEDLQKFKKELYEYCKKNNIDPTHYFEEIGSSKDDEREAYNQLINHIKTGKFQVLVISDLGRLTRDLEQQLKLFKLLVKHKMVIHSLLDGTIDPAEKTNKMMGVLKGVFNEMVYEETSEKMHLGRLLSARDGKYIGTPPYGYKKNKNLQIEPDEIEALVVKRIFRETIEGYSTTEIAVRLHRDGIKTQRGNDFTSSAISRLLNNRTYIGEYSFKSEKFNEKVTKKNNHEAIITPEEFLQVKNTLANRRRFSLRIHDIISPLEKLIVCGKCGRLMSINLVQRKYVFLQKCNAYKYGEICDNKGANLRHILPKVYKDVNERIGVVQVQLERLYEGSSNDRLEALQKELKGFEKLIKGKEKEKDKLLDLLLKERITELRFSDKDKELDEEIKKLKQRHEDTLEAIANSNVSNDIEYIEKILENLTNLETQAVDSQNRTLKSIIDKIVYIREGNDISIDIQFKD
ncbi:recombinase family protein [Bacillus sp. X1(2014)]|uniref:recombinase family protein n=1 Tax=Bacillus sp. X1(2014) TaxID=1565991 RepID=UPI0011A4071E|nr:recombinase family protein [Bacillus sp. X1(2014)]